MRRQSGFTLIELMIAVAIIGILAATAVAGFQIYQLRTKRSEAMVNVEALAKMQKGYFGEFGTYVPNPSGVTFPNVPLTPLKKSWDAATRVEFRDTGFSVEGSVYHSYGVNTCACPNCFTAHADGDLDADASVGSIAYFHAPDGPSACSTLIAGFRPNVVAGNPVLNTVAVVSAPNVVDDY